MSQFEITLSPFALGSDIKPFSMEEPQWRRAVSLVEATGYRGNFFAGMDRTTTKHFVRGLRQALQQERASPDQSTVLTALVAFLEGAGAGGTALTRGYRRLNRA